MAIFSDFIGLVLKNGKDLVQTTITGFEGNAEEDIKAYLVGDRNILQTWTEQLAKGSLAREEYADLVQGELPIAELATLTQAGVAVADLERLRVGLTKVVVDAAFDTLWPK